MIYLWLKVLHILAVTSWMAGLFYLPRLFVYHVGQKPGSETDGTFKIMERRLLKAIMRPAAVVALASGVGLVGLGGAQLSEPWLWIKLVMVLAMIAFHGSLECFARLFAAGGRPASEQFFRWWNEVPTLLLIVIVIVVVVRPFS